MSSDTIAAVFAIAAGVIVFGLLITGAVLVIRDTVRQRGRWGLNFSAPRCRHCTTPMPVVRVPASFSQALWGGWTCSECGLEVDKWGEPIPNQKAKAKWNTPLVDPRTNVNPPRRPDDRTTPPNNDVRR
jgi:hypothetical protein